MLILGSLPLIVAVKIAQLQIMPSEERGVEFLQTQGDARAIRTETIPGHRGLITDRNGEPLAVSTPVITLIANPKRVNENAQPDDLTKLAKALNISLVQLQSRLKRYRNKSFMYLARQLPSVEADRILDLQIPGVFGRQEYKRFYPAGEVTAQLVGFTDINDAGQEGMELAYNAVLAGEPGAKKVVKDLAGRVIKDISLVKPASHGSTLRLSIDLRVQYAAYRALKASVKKHAAKSGSVIVLDVQTGEVLAMANQPSFNPNDRSNLRVDSVRNRSVIDMMEPGSTVKPFTILAALESGKFKPDTVINTSPGYIKVAYKTFYDRRDLGRLSLTDILNKSSQVGTTKLALALNPNNTRELFERMGFGEGIGSGFPGETAGNLPAYRKWDPVTQATYTFGYGFSASPLQLARAYSILANDGLRREVRMTAIDQYQDESVRVINADLVKTVRQMLETAASDQGTGRLAVIDGYSVGGKTGTARKIKATGGYDENRHMSLFAGLSPINNPRLVTVVVIDEPNEDKYAGGVVAAPVFSEVTGSALRLMQVTPDAMSAERNIVSLPAMLAKRGGL
ncbi:MAG: penicillin-binding transpeptidase domain-containing protein [Porticoccaceae bacterium]|nr:penicillin-binding transpeptidase domain-containing protein [Porticoccaceae bacterium]